MNRREKLLLLIPVLLALSIGGAPVVADPIGAVRRIVYTCQTSAPSPINTNRTWIKCSNLHAMRTNSSNVDVDLESGGGGGSTDGLKAAHEAASSAAQNVTTATAALGTPTFKDNGGDNLIGFRATDASETWDLIQTNDDDGSDTVRLGYGPWDFQTSIPTGTVRIENTLAASGAVPIQGSGSLYLGGRCWDGSASRACGGLVVSKSETSGASYTGELDFYVRRNATNTWVGGFSYNGSTNLFAAVNIGATATLSAGTALSIEAGADVTAAGGASDLDFSASSGLTKTGTGAVSINGNATMASGKTLTVNNVTTNGFVGPNYGGTSTNVPTVTWTSVGGGGAPAFQNSWTNDTAVGTYPTAAFFKDAIGQVHLKGYVTGGSVGTTVFTLPAGYRPLQTQFLYTWQGSLVLVYATGNVDVAAAGAASSALHGIFMAEQ